jgi:hypothetical protein
MAPVAGGDGATECSSFENKAREGRVKAGAEQTADRTGSEE